MTLGSEARDRLLALKLIPGLRQFMRRCVVADLTARQSKSFSDWVGVGRDPSRGEVFALPGDFFATGHACNLSVPRLMVALWNLEVLAWIARLRKFRNIMKISCDGLMLERPSITSITPGRSRS